MEETTKSAVRNTGSSIAGAVALAKISGRELVVDDIGLPEVCADAAHRGTHAEANHQKTFLLSHTDAR